MSIFQIRFKYLNDDYHEYLGTFIKECLYDAIKQLKLDNKFNKNKLIIIKAYKSNLTLKDLGFPTNNFRKLIDLILKDSNLTLLAKLHGIHVKDIKNETNN